MTILKLELDIDWIGEEGDLADAIKSEIMNSVVSKISANASKLVEESVSTIINENVSTIINDKLNETLDDFVNKKRTITDKWGDTKKTDLTVIDIMKDAFDNYMDALVDKDGWPLKGNYGGKKRIDYIVDKNLDYTMKNTVDKAVREVKEQMQKYVETTIKTQIGENMASIIGLDSIIKKM